LEGKINQYDCWKCQKDLDNNCAFCKGSGILKEGNSFLQFFDQIATCKVHAILKELGVLSQVQKLKEEVPPGL